MIRNRRLQKLYRENNARYFGGRLPDIPVTFGRLPYIANGETQLRKWVPVRIVISRRYILKDGRLDKQARRTLLHEMVHTESPEIDCQCPTFNKRIHKLVAAGAFDGLL